jgi:hypothetical protein
MTEVVLHVDNHNCRCGQIQRDVLWLRGESDAARRDAR